MDQGRVRVIYERGMRMEVSAFARVVQRRREIENVCARLREVSKRGVRRMVKVNEVS